MASVLVVDDETVLLEMMAALIADLGYRVITATNGYDALAALSRETAPPDLIISDVMMPCMDGVELAREVRGSPRWRDVPVILMSAAGLPRNRHTADYFLDKPFDIDDLITLIEQHAQ